MTEGQFVTQHSDGFVKAMLRNPQLLTWITSKLRAMKRESSRDQFRVS
ncbi:MAG: hypothetical protein KKC79_05490 [Gammaproteobacteria bacterium]|nr:hypothetical protein [Gammaproteobacteria bacterium]